MPERETDELCAALSAESPEFCPPPPTCLGGKPALGWLPLLLAFGLLLALAAGPVWAQTPSVDYDTDDDRLIEVDSLDKLSAIRHDENGDGLRGTVSVSDWGNYTTAFPNASATQCPTSCQGYELTADLTFPASGTHSAWTPFSVAANAIFDGNGHTLTDLKVSNNDHVGLFRAVDGTVRNVGVVNAAVTMTVQGRSAGALIGILGGTGTVETSYASGGTITLSPGADQPTWGGGLIGETTRNSTVRGVWSSAAVTTNRGSAMRMGGLIGAHYGALSYSFSYGTVHNSGSGNTHGKFMGRCNNHASISYSFFDTSTSGPTAGVASRHSGCAGGPGGRTTAQLQAPTDYTGIYEIWNLDLDSDKIPDYLWNFGTSSQYPTLNTPAQRAALTPAPVVDYDANDNGLIDINNPAQLHALRWDVNGDGDPSNVAGYGTAFAGRIVDTATLMGCPSGTCTGYELTGNMTMPSSGRFANWSAIGGFATTFDGNGFTITNLASTTAGDGGLFGNIVSGGTVRNLGLINPSIAPTSASARANGIMASVVGTGATISKSYVSGGSLTISIQGSNGGGLIGALRGGTLQATYSTAAVTAGGTATTLYIGGLAGRAESGTITASYAAGTVTNSSSNAATNVGGLVGVSAGTTHTITNSYCSAATTQTNCIGSATGSSTQTSTRYTAAQMQSPQAYTGTIYSGWNLNLDGQPGADDPWDFGATSEYPTLKFPAPTDYDADDDGLIEISSSARLDVIRHDLDGNGAPEFSGPYHAAFPNRDDTAGGRMGCPSGACTGYELTADISLSGYTSWTPIGGSFTATFEGNGHAITNLTITNATADDVGLFGLLGPAGVIRRVAVTGASVTGNIAAATGSQELGILAGESVGTIRFCYTTGSVTQSGGGDFNKTGGLVGHLHDNGRIDASYSTATVTGPSSGSTGVSTGGLVGAFGSSLLATGVLNASYASGTVSATADGTRVGGLIGEHRSGTIQYSYAYGGVSLPGGSALTNVGGLVGQDSGGADSTVTASYYDGGATGQSDTGKGTSQTTMELQQETSYGGAGDIYENWNTNVDGVAGNDDPWDFGTASQYPALKVDFDNDGTDSAYEFGMQGRSAAQPPVDPNPPPASNPQPGQGNGNGNGGSSPQPVARGGGQPYHPASAHPEIYTNPRHEMSVSCEVRTSGEGDEAVSTSTLTFDLGTYTRPITLVLSLWDGQFFRTLQSQNIPMPQLRREGRMATVEVVTDPAQTRFRIDSQYGLNLVLGYADCRTDDPE